MKYIPPTFTNSFLIKNITKLKPSRLRTSKKRPHIHTLKIKIIDLEFLKHKIAKYSQMNIGAFIAIYHTVFQECLNIAYWLHLQNLLLLTDTSFYIYLTCSWWLLTHCFMHACCMMSCRLFWSLGMEATLTLGECPRGFGIDALR